MLVFLLLFGPAFSSDNAGDGPSTADAPDLGQKPGKGKRVHGIKSSRGTSELQEVASGKKRERESHSKAKPEMKAHELMRILENQEGCCSASKGKGGCFCRHFRTEENEVDLPEALKAFIAMRKDHSQLAKSQIKTEQEKLFLSANQFCEASNTWIPTEERKITINGKSHRVCSRVYAESHGMSYNQYKKTSRRLKKCRLHLEGILETLHIRDISYIELVGDVTSSPPDDSQVPLFSHQEAEEVFRVNVPSYTKDMPRFTYHVVFVLIRSFMTRHRYGLAPLNRGDQIAIAWLNHHFEHYGDQSPNSLETMLSITHKKEVYEQYRSQLKTSHEKLVRLERFYEIWISLFPLAVNRPWCDIPGKCETCYEIDQLRRTTTSLAVLKALQQAHLLHRGGMFNQERALYKKRVLEALLDDRSNPQVMSIIIDGMDNNKCRCPYLGRQNSFDAPVPQHIIGVKEHGHVSFYNNHCICNI